MKYPKECPLFRDRDSVYTALYEATGFQRDRDGVAYGLTVREHYAYDNGHQVSVDGGWCDIDFLVPLTPTARDMLAIARGTR